MIQRTKYQQYTCARKEHTFFIPWQTIGCPQTILRWFSVFCPVSRCFWYRSFGVQKAPKASGFRRLLRFISFFCAPIGLCFLSVCRSGECKLQADRSLFRYRSLPGDRFQRKSIQVRIPPAGNGPALQGFRLCFQSFRILGKESHSIPHVHLSPCMKGGKLSDLQSTAGQRRNRIPRWIRQRKNHLFFGTRCGSRMSAGSQTGPKDPCRYNQQQIDRRSYRQSPPGRRGFCPQPIFRLHYALMKAFRDGRKGSLFKQGIVSFIQCTISLSASRAPSAFRARASRLFTVPEGMASTAAISPVV